MRPLLLACLMALLPWPAAAQATAVVDPPRGDLRVAVFGDFNGPYGSLDYPPAVARTVALLTGPWRPDLLLLPGDLIAGQDRSLPDDRFDRMWAAFEEVVAAPLRAAGIPYAATMGNHDGSSLRALDGSLAFERERAAARRYWTAPHHRHGLEAVVESDVPFGYAFRSGPLFVVVVDASSANLGQAQLDWLERLLASPDAQEARLRWVLGHLPLVAVSEGRDRPGEVLNGAEAMHALLLAGGVDAYISGHHAAHFPVHWAGLELMHMGGVGGRRLLGSDQPPRSTVALIDVWWDAEAPRVRLTAFDLATLQPLPPEAMPASLATPWGRLPRSTRIAH